MTQSSQSYLLQASLLWLAQVAPKTQVPPYPVSHGKTNLLQMELKVWRGNKSHISAQESPCIKCGGTHRTERHSTCSSSGIILAKVPWGKSGKEVTKISVSYHGCKRCLAGLATFKADRTPTWKLPIQPHLRIFRQSDVHRCDGKQYEDTTRWHPWV